MEKSAFLKEIFYSNTKFFEKKFVNFYIEKIKKQKKKEN